jgi:hypothetical protein
MNQQHVVFHVTVHRHGHIYGKSHRHSHGHGHRLQFGQGYRHGHPAWKYTSEFRKRMLEALSKSSVGWLEWELTGSWEFLIMIIC